MRKQKDVKEAGGSKSIFKVGLVIVIVIGFVWSMAGSNLLQTNINSGNVIFDEIVDEVTQPENDDGYTMSWKEIDEFILPPLADENATISVPGVNTSGILSVYFHPHMAVPMNDYFENSSTNLESNCTTAGLGWSGEDDNESDLTHSTTFDVVFRVQGNNSNCKVGGVFYDTNLKIQWTCAGLSVGADTELTSGAGEGRYTANDTTYTYLYMNFWDDNGGSGFTISQDQTVEITSIKLLGYF